eukprot:1085493-Pyramimonas_sp.AAC.1
MPAAERARWHCRLRDARVTALRATHNLERGVKVTVNHSPFLTLTPPCGRARSPLTAVRAHSESTSSLEVALRF